MAQTTFSNGESQTCPSDLKNGQSPNEDEQQYLDLISRIIAKGIIIFL